MGKEQEEGHTFEITFRSRGSYKVVGDKEFTDSSWWSGPKTIQVRAWDLPAALRKAGEQPLTAWSPEEDES